MGKRAAPFVYPIGLWAALLGIIQGIAWTIFTIISILLYYQVFVHEPKYDSYSSILTSTIYILYFNNDLLSDFGATVDDILVTPNILVIFSWIYLFLSFIWFCWSCWQLWVVLHKKLKFTKTSFVVWSVIAILVAVLDIVLISLLANDYNYYNTYRSNDGGIVISVYVILANGILLCCAARGFLLWLINVIFVSVLIKIIVSGVEEDSYEDRVDRRPINAFAPVRKPSREWIPENTNQSQINNNNNTDAWISNPAAIINEAFDFMGEDKPLGFHRTQSLSTIQNATTSIPNGSVKTSSPISSYKVATVGRKGISATTLAPFIPEPDYTPPVSPASERKPVLKSVLKNHTQYA